MAGYKNFADTDTLTAADVNGYLMLQTEMRFASTDDRNTDLSAVLTEGLWAYTGVHPQFGNTAGNNTRWMYDGSAWQPWDSPWKVWTPTINNFTLGDGTNEYRWRYQAGDLELRGITVFGAETAVTGTLTITLPNSETSHAAGPSQGTVFMLNFPDGEQIGHARVDAGTTTVDLLDPGGGSVWDATSPVTWAENDYWVLDMRVAL